jgi:4-amino-4-deoxy-L-arabinose transferase-like glycosyltransferase
LAIAVVGAFDLLFRIGTPDWSPDELTYRNFAWAAFHGGPALTPNSPPPLAKHIVGVFELLFGRSVVPVRMSAVIAGILTGVFLALIARRMAGDWAAIITAAIWFVLPHPDNFKLERYALLDVYMAMFTTLAILLAAQWGVSRKWRWIVASGVAAGAATACKLPGALVIVPIGVYVVASCRFSVRAILQTCALGLAAVGAFVAAYVPSVLQMPAQLRFMIDWQSNARAQGHAVLVAGRVYLHPPWWTQLRWQWDASWVLTLCYLAVVIIAVVAARRDSNLALLLGTLATIFGFFAFVSHNILPHYPYAWAPVLAVVTGLTIHRLARRGGVARVGAIVLALALAIPAVQLIRQTADIRPTDYEAAAALLRKDDGPKPDLIVIGYGTVLCAYMPRCHLSADTATAHATGVVVDPALADRMASRGRSRFLHAHAGEFDRHRIGRLTVYLPDID